MNFIKFFNASIRCSIFSWNMFNFLFYFNLSFFFDLSYPCTRHLVLPNLLITSLLLQFCVFPNDLFCFCLQIFILFDIIQDSYSDICYLPPTSVILHKCFGSFLAFDSRYNYRRMKESIFIDIFSHAGVTNIEDGMKKDACWNVLLPSLCKKLSNNVVT